MRQLPYLVPENNASLNVGLLVLIIQALGKTDRGKLLLNNERLLIFMYLIKNPVLMAQILGMLGREQVYLSPQESHSVSSISVNLDPLFDNDWIKRLLQFASSQGYLKATYKKGEGFLYSLTQAGEKVACKLDGDYLGTIRRYLRALEPIKSQTTPALNTLLNANFKG